MKNSLKVPVWWLKRDSNTRPSGRIDSTDALPRPTCTQTCTILDVGCDGRLAWLPCSEIAKNLLFLLFLLLLLLLLWRQVLSISECHPFMFCHWILELH